MTARLPFPFVLATGNADKAREILEIFAEATGELLAASAIDYRGQTYGYLVAPGDTIAAAVEELDVLHTRPEVQETGATLDDNARIKAEGMRAATGMTAIADDTGLEVDALGGAPGVYSARYAGPDASYSDNVEKLVRELAGLPTEQRTARFATVAHVAGRNGGQLTVRGEVAGVIAGAPRGAGSFGYDPVFVPNDGDGRTFAEMSATEKHARSHRGLAFRALVDALGESSPGNGTEEY